jgi:hypothetical protein
MELNYKNFITLSNKMRKNFKEGRFNKDTINKLLIYLQNLNLIECENNILIYKKILNHLKKYPNIDEEVNLLIKDYFSNKTFIIYGSFMDKILYCIEDIEDLFITKQFDNLLKQKYN